MIDNVLNLLFRCSHRRITRPVTPVTLPGAVQAETYVVCLDCGKHFLYDFKKMHIGRAIAPPPATKLLPPDVPKSHHTGMRLALFASAVSALIALFGIRRSRTR